MFQKNQKNLNFILPILTILIYFWSIINPHDYFVWFLETAPSFVGLTLMILTRKKFPLSAPLYNIILIHMIILAIGGHYTYAEMPLFNYFKEVFNLSRNNYDKVGHFFQGITPALLMREIILRKTNLKTPIFIFIFSVATALSFSALYEIFEWIIAISTDSGDDFIGTQGDIWDTQKDMLTALLGAIFILTFFAKIHDKSLKNLK